MTRALAAALVLVVAVGSVPATVGTAPAVHVDATGERLTVRATDVALGVLLRALAEQTGVALDLRDALTETVTVDLNGLGLEEVFRRLLHRHSAVMLYDDGRGPSAIIVLGSGGPGDPRPSGSTEDDASDAPPQADWDTPEWRASLRLQAFESVLDRYAGVETPEGLRTLQEAIAGSDRAARLTALQWLAADRDVLVEALVTTVASSDDTLRRASLEVLLARGVDDEAAAEIQRVAEHADFRTLRALLTRALMP